MAQAISVSKQVLEEFEDAGAQLVRLDVMTPEDQILLDLVDDFNGIESVNKARDRWERYLADQQITQLSPAQFVFENLDSFFRKDSFLMRSFSITSLLAMVTGEYDSDAEKEFNQYQLYAQQEFAWYMDGEKTLSGKRLRLDAIFVPSWSKPMARATDGGYPIEALLLSGLFKVVFPELRIFPDFDEGHISGQLGSSLGLPCLMLPAGFTPDGVPIGVQLVGRAFSEPELIRLGYGYEQATRHRRAANL